MKRPALTFCLLLALASYSFAGDGVLWPGIQPTPEPTPQAIAAPPAEDEAALTDLIAATIRAFFFIL